MKAKLEGILLGLGFAGVFLFISWALQSVFGEMLR